MIEHPAVRGGLVSASVLVAVGLTFELLDPSARAVGLGIIFGGWVSLVLALVRLGAGSRGRR